MTVETMTLDEWAATVARDRAIATVELASDVSWMDRALHAIYTVCREHDTFSVDDVWGTGLESTRENRALGAAMLAARRKGYCTPTDTYRPTNQVRSHAAPIRIWKSCIR